MLEEVLLEALLFFVQEDEKMDYYPLNQLQLHEFELLREEQLRPENVRLLNFSFRTHFFTLEEYVNGEKKTPIPGSKRAREGAVVT